MAENPENNESLALVVGEIRAGINFMKDSLSLLRAEGQDRQKTNSELISSMNERLSKVEKFTWQIAAVLAVVVVLIPVVLKFVVV